MQLSYVTVILLKTDAFVFPLRANRTVVYFRATQTADYSAKMSQQTRLD